MPGLATIQTHPIATVEQQLAVHGNLIEQIDRLLPLPEDLRFKLLRHEASPVSLLARFVGPLPASEQHHDSDTYGLFRHTLEVVASSLTKFLARPGRPDPANVRGVRKWNREIVTVFSAAILHDIGKLLFMHVEPIGGRMAKPWTPKRGYLLDYCAEHGATSLQVGWHWGRMKSGMLGHESLGLWVREKIILLDLLDAFGVEQANNLIAILARSLGSPLDGLGDLMKDADVEISMRSMRASVRSGSDADGGFIPAPGQIAPLVDLPPLGSSTRAHDFVVMFRAMAKGREIQINGLNSDCYVSATHTLIPIGNPARSKRGRSAGGEIPLMRRIAERIRGLIITDPQAPKEARDAYSVCEGHLFLPDFAALSTGAGGWCVPCSATPLEGYAAIKHYLTIERARGAAYGETPCIVVRNEILWGTVDPTTLFNLFVDPIVLWDGPSKSQPSVDPEVLGFRAVDRPTSVPVSKADPSEARSMIGLTFAHRTWQSLDRISPYHHLPAAIRDHWQALAVRLATPNLVADETLLLTALEAIADRLDDLAQAHDQRTEQRSPAPAQTDAPVAEPAAAPAAEIAPPAPVHPAEPPKQRLPTTPLQRTDLLYRRLAWLASRPASELPSVAGSHPAAHFLVDAENRCYIAWPAAAVAACADLDLTEVEASRLLDAVALRLNAERQDSDHPWLQPWEWKGVTSPPPRSHGFYLVVNRDTVSLVTDPADGVGVPDLPCWNVTDGRLIAGEDDE